MSEARRLLLVSFFYPPDPAVGGLRAAKFTQYLPDFGWEPTVLTARTLGDQRPPDYVHATPFRSPWARRASRAPDAHASRGSRLSMRDRASRGPLTRTLYQAARHVLPLSSVRMPDATLGWVRSAVAAGRRLIDESNFDAILSSAGPPSSHIVAARLQRASGLPWVADYRDLWSDNHWDARIPPFRWLERRLEKWVLRGADSLTSVSFTLARRLEGLHGKPVELIFNGFDPEDYPARPPQHPGFDITYVGTLSWPQQDPTPLFRAIGLLQERSDLDLDGLGLRLHFLGSQTGPLPELAERHNIARRVLFSPPVSHAESLARQTASGALLLLSWSDPSEDIVFAKMFEYLGARRPVLAVGPSSLTMSHILKECGMDDFSADPAALADRLGHWLRSYAETGQLPSRSAPATRGYTRREQTRRLADWLRRRAYGGSAGRKTNV